MSPAYWFDVMFQRLQTPNKYGYLVDGKIIRHTLPPASPPAAEFLA